MIILKAKKAHLKLFLEQPSEIFNAIRKISFFKNNHKILKNLYFTLLFESLIKNKNIIPLF